MKKFDLSVSLGVVVLAALAACSSTPPEYAIPATASPPEEIGKFERNLQEVRSLNGEVFAAGDFQRSEKWLKEAKEDLNGKQSTEEILNDVRQGQSYLQRARGTTEMRAQQAGAISSARQSAIKAGALEYPKIKDKLHDADEDLRDEAGNLSRLKAEKVIGFQQRYLNIELEAVKARQLGMTKTALEQLKKNDADDKAPLAYKQAQIDYNTALNQVAANRSDESSFAEAVAKANRSVAFLGDVMKEMKLTKGTKEAAATEIVLQRDRIADLNKTIVTQTNDTRAAQGEIANREAQIAAREGQLSETEERLRTANQSVRMQEAIESARKEFGPYEAEVFQQGPNLVVRLKSLQFTSGRSELPAQSMAIIAKVNSVAQKLDPQAVAVEGHTDSLGSKAVNQNLSNQRAQIVADYLQNNGLQDANITTAGYGFDKPIASNKTKGGRAQNRRVDVIITPKTTVAAGAPNAPAASDVGSPDVAAPTLSLPSTSPAPAAR